ncbi:IS110 family transposase [Pinisolibacter sp.]|uniref:IS110 family transposase n=1 Tax=Pinisolibacter sp. TaxID=2172024 RepID=UPI002FDC9416
MDHYVGLDVSHKTTHVCVVRADRRVVWRGSCDTNVELLATTLERWRGSLWLVGLETGSLTPWLFPGLSAAGFPMVCMDARRAADAMRARPEKTDKADAQALAEMLACSWYSEVHVKSPASHRLKALLTARGQLVSVRTQLYGQIRGLLRPFGVKISSRSGSKGFVEAVGTACQREDVLHAAVSVLLTAPEAITEQIVALDRRVAELVGSSSVCRLLTSVPGVGAVTAPAFMATVEDPGRFGRSRSLGAYVGLTPKRYRSGERDVTGSISRQGDGLLRHYLYEAANCLLTTVRQPSALRSWGLRLMKRIGPKKARVAVARKLAVLLIGSWKRDEVFAA